MTNPINNGRAANRAQHHLGIRSFSQKVLDFWRKISCVNANAVRRFSWDAFDESNSMSAIDGNTSHMHEVNSPQDIVNKLVLRINDPVSPWAQGNSLKDLALKANLSIYSDAMMRTEGLLAVLINKTQSPDDRVKINAMSVLAKLSVDQENQVALMKEEGLLAALINNTQSPDGKVKIQAMSVLAKLSVHQENQVALMKEEGLLAALINNTQSPDDRVKIQAMSVLAKLSVHQENQVVLMKEEGFLRSLINNFDGSEDVVCAAMGVVTKLLTHQENTVELKQIPGRIIQDLIDPPSFQVQKDALKKLKSMVMDSFFRDEMMHTEGLLGALINKIQSPNGAFKRDALSVLEKLATDPENRVGLMQADGLVAGLINNLESSDDTVKRPVLSVLKNLAANRNNRLAMMSTPRLRDALTASSASPNPRIEEAALSLLGTLWPGGIIINNAQSTHVVSAHKSASQNSVLLKDNFPSKNLSAAYSEFSKWINNLSVDNAEIVAEYANQSYKNRAAQEWIASPLHLDHMDVTSGVSVKQFLALFWLAAQDDSPIREPDVEKEAALFAIVEALYEIKRGYNLSSDLKPKDNGMESRNICAGGTFNKISEKMPSVITDAKSHTLNLETLIISIHANIRNQVKTLSKADESVNQELKDNAGYLTENVWNKIKDEVIAQIKDEFEEDPNEAPLIGAKRIEVHISEQTDFENILAYFKI